jgi:signal transduction histidine kinase/ligand-binding sensor domain-containing protein
MENLKRLFLIAGFAALHFFSFSQIHTTQYLKRRPVKAINFAQGLLNNETTDVITDVDGFTWVSTRTGLQRFNGYTLENINPVIGSDTIFINSPVYLFALQNGSIWISYEKGVLLYSPSLKTFKKIIPLQASENMFFSIVPLHETKEGVWCMMEGRGIVIYTDNKIQSSSIPVNISRINDILSSDDILNNTIITTNKHYLFIRVNNNLLLQINTDAHQFKYITDKQNIIGIGCNNETLFTISETQLSAINISTGNTIKKYPLKNMFEGHLSYSCIMQENEGKLLVSLNGHLYEFDTGAARPNEFISLNEDAFVPNGFVHRIYTDAFKRIWLLTNNDIRIMQDFDTPFEHYIYKNETSNFVRTIYFDAELNQIFAGCIAVANDLSGGIQLYDTSGNPLWSKALTTDKVRNISGIEKLSVGKYLIITTDREGWYMLSMPEKKLDKFYLPADAQTQSQISANVWPNNVQRINDSTLFIASSVNIFRCIFQKTKLISAKPLLPFNGNPSNIINCFISTSEKNLWTGTNAGVIYILQKNGSLQTMHIPGNYIIRCFAEDALHHIWIGTDKGIYIYTNAGQLIKMINDRSGLLNDYIYAILPVEKNAAAFVSSKLGLSYVSLNDSIKNYTKELGLQENEFNTGSSLKTSTGKFYFGGINGMSAFYPSSLSEINDNPVLNITRLTVNDSLCDFSPNIWRNDSIILKYNQNYLQFDVAALGLLNTDEYEYKYRLKGFEEDWQTTHEATGIKYVLQPGNYLFEISCTPIFSANKIFKKTIVIIISPPWWQTWWFRILMIAVFIALIVSVVRQYLTRQYRKKLNELQLQQEIQYERERISRDLHDNIGAQISFISSNIDWVIDKKKDMNKEEELKQMKEINVTAKNVMTNLRDTIWALHKEEITLQEFSDKLKSYIQNMSRLQSDIEFISEEKINKNFILTPTEMLGIFRICQESINNVIKHAEATLLKLFIFSDERSFYISIEDNGKGFDQTEKLNEHYGLENMKHRAEELNAKVVIISAEGKGTTVTIHK